MTFKTKINRNSHRIKNLSLAQRLRGKSIKKKILRTQKYKKKINNCHIYNLHTINIVFYVAQQQEILRLIQFDNNVKYLTRKEHKKKKKIYKNVHTQQNELLKTWHRSEKN